MKLTRTERAVFSKMGKIGGTARAKKLSPERRAEIARFAATKRFNLVGVYFGLKDGLIKIGASCDVERRCRQLNLNIIGVIKCPREVVFHLEWAAIRRNAAYCVQVVTGPGHCEWFTDCQDVRATIQGGIAGLLPYLGTSMPSQRRKHVIGVCERFEKRAARRAGSR